MFEKIIQELNSKIISHKVDESLMLYLNISAHELRLVLSYLKSNGFDILTDLTAVDYPEREERFEIIYNLLNIYKNQRIIVKVLLADNESIDSIHDIYSASIWYEREVWDMFGIYFNNNPDLRRIGTDYGFEGHPLRKDFPLTGYKEVYYDQEQGKVVYTSVKLPQDYRNFDFQSPWEGPKYIIPGDEKKS